MSQKTAAAYHGVACDGRCCRNPHGVCHHGRVCAHHLKESAREARAEKEAQIIADLERAAHQRGRRA